MTRAPLVSVVIPTRNRAARLCRAVASAAAQTCADLEIIVVDDGSTDDSGDVLDRLAAHDPRIRVTRHSDPRGGGAARNQGLDLSQGEFVAFLDDDDEWLPAKLERQVAFLRDHPGTGAASCHHEVRRPSGAHATHRGPSHCEPQDLLWDNFLGSASFCLWHRPTIGRPEPRFDPQLQSCQDWDFWIQLARRAPVVVVDDVLCRYVEHDEGRITASPSSRQAGRHRILAKYGHEMTDDCRCYNEARIALLAGTPHAAVGWDVLRQCSPRVARILISTSLAGRVGQVRRDPGRGSRRLHSLVRTR